MKKFFTLFAIFISIPMLLVFTPVKTNATTHLITVQNTFFSPSTVNALVGDTIHFQWINGSHTTTCNDLFGSRPPGADEWDSPINSGNTDFYYPLAVAGSYVYFCQPHAPGMTGTINAGYGYKIWAGNFGGGDGTSWSDPLNWLDGSVPTSTDSVLLDNSQVPFTYVVNLPTGAVKTTLSKLVVHPDDVNYIYLNLTSANTKDTALMLGNGIGNSYDFVIYKHGIFTNSSGASAGTGVYIVNTADSVQLLDSALWIHNCTRGTSGVVQKFSKAPNTRLGIFRFDVPTLSAFSITASGITYGTLQLYGTAAGGGLLSKKYVTAGGTALTVRGDLYIEEHAYDSSAMTNNLNIGGNYTCFGKIVFGPIASQRLNFNGTTLQTITCDGLTSASFTISTGMIFNNAAGFYLTSPFYGDTVTMTNGNINSAPFAWLGIGYDATNSGTLIRTAGIVTGQIERWYLAGAVSDSLSFPVGTSSTLKEAKVRFSTAPTTAGRIGMKFIDNGTNGSDLPSTLNDGGFQVNRRSNSYWHMTGTFLTGGLIFVSLDGNGQEGITDPQNTRVVWSNDGGTSFSLQGNHVPGNASIGRRDGIGFYFSDFYLGGNTTVNPLPVELDNFVATTIKNEVILDWATGHEQNNDGFEIQRATLAQNGAFGELISTASYQTVGFVDSKGNANFEQVYKFSDKNLQAGRYAYRLKQVDLNGNFTYFTLNNEVFVNIPAKFFISQNYPNPFNPVTNIKYEMPFDGMISIVVYDNLGREIKTLINGNVAAGYYKAEFNASGLPSGLYFYKVNAVSSDKSYVKVFKMILVK